MSELLFSYGRPRQHDVQLATFGRDLDGYLDAIIGYDLDSVTISDPELAAADEYDVDDYRRISGPLRSGAQAWFCVFAG